MGGSDQRERGGKRFKMFGRFLDHLEEWLIAFLMGAATLLIFVAIRRIIPRSSGTWKGIPFAVEWPAWTN